MENCESDFFKLIDCVKEKRSLYDKKDPFYYNKFIREKTWQEVAEGCGRSANECKHRWKLLRERFGKELKKLECPSDNGGEEWKFMPAMMWLRDCMQSRRSRYADLQPTSFVSMNAVESEGSLLEPLVSPTSTSPVPSKRSKYTLDTLVQKFGETLENIESQLIETESSESTHETATTDEAVASALVCLMKDLPLAVKDKFQAQMFQELYQLRSEHRKYKK